MLRASRGYYKEHSLFIESVERMVAQELEPKVDGWEKDGNFPDQVFEILGKAGFLGLLISEDYGGVGGDYSLAGAWCEAFGELRSVGLTVGVNMHSVVVSHSLDQNGSKEMKERWLPDAVAGKAIGAYAFTEPGVGSDLANLRTKAEKKGGKWIINGAKTFITNGARADFLLVLARTNPSAGYKGFTTFVVDAKAPGFKVNRKLDKLGWRASDTAEMTFENVEVDDSAILGKEGQGWYLASNNLSWERMMLVLTTLGGAKACFRDALRYTREREAFGQKIGRLGAIRDMLRSMYSTITISESLSHQALNQIIAGKPSRLPAALAKRFVCDECVKLADLAIQIHGGYGYTTEYSAERWWRDLRLMPIGGGTSQIMGDIVAKELKWL